MLKPNSVSEGFSSAMIMGSSKKITNTYNQFASLCRALSGGGAYLRSRSWLLCRCCLCFSNVLRRSRSYASKNILPWLTTFRFTDVITPSVEAFLLLLRYTAFVKSYRDPLKGRRLEGTQFCQRQSKKVRWGKTYRWFIFYTPALLRAGRMYWGV